MGWHHTTESACNALKAQNPIMTHQSTLSMHFGQWANAGMGVPLTATQGQNTIDVESKRAVSYKKDKENPFTHSTRISTLNPTFSTTSLRR